MKGPLKSSWIQTFKNIQSNKTTVTLSTEEKPKISQKSKSKPILINQISIKILKLGLKVSIKILVIKWIPYSVSSSEILIFILQIKKC